MDGPFQTHRRFTKRDSTSLTWLFATLNRPVPEYLAPDVYVEETSFRPKSIEGVSTSTAGFVGPARFGPTSGEPRLLTSFADYQRIYGGLEDLDFEDKGRKTNYLAYAVRAFFEEGGQRCYVARVFNETSSNNGIAQGTLEGGDLTAGARYPGTVGEMTVTFRTVSSRDVSGTDGGDLPGLSLGQTVFAIPGGGTPLEGESSDKNFYDYVLDDDGDPSLQNDEDDLSLKADQLKAADSIFPFRVRVLVQRPIRRPGGGGTELGPEEDLGTFNFRPRSTQALVDALSEENPAGDPVMTPIYVEELQDGGDPFETGTGYASELFGDELSGASEPDDFSEVQIPLTDGNDGDEPVSYATDVTGPLPPEEPEGFDALEDLDDVSIVAAPGYTDIEGESDRQNVQGELIAHCEDMQYRIAVLDTPKASTVKDARDWRGQIDSKYAAMYYPWVTIFDSRTRSELNVPPSGHVAGIYARNDVENGVHKAPANEVVRTAVGFENRINKAQQDVLNPEGVNCFRFFEGRGNRLWGARMATSDPEFKYVNIRRTLAYLERSIDQGTQVFVFENNGEDLWRNVRRTISSFLMNEWRSDRLMGTTPEEAFFVRCDRSTMTQNDIDNGRLICEIGVALFRPAEFVIFRIGQKLLSDTG